MSAVKTHPSYKICRTRLSHGPSHRRAALIADRAPRQLVATVATKSNRFVRHVVDRHARTRWYKWSRAVEHSVLLTENVRMQVCERAKRALAFGATRRLKGAPAGDARSELALARSESSSFAAQSIMRLATVTSLFLLLATVLPISVGITEKYAVMGSYAAIVCTLMIVNRLRPLGLLAAASGTLIDLIAITATFAIAGGFPSETSPYSPLFENLYFLIPVMAAFQLSPAVTAVGSVLSIIAYIIGARSASTPEAWAFVAAHSIFIGLIGAACVTLSVLQRSRSRKIGRLARQRSHILGKLMTLEERERHRISEVIHDGALQFVLAALQETREISRTPTADFSALTDSLARIESSLVSAGQLMRSSVVELNSDILEAGLGRAVEMLARSAATRGGFSLDYSTNFPDQPPTPADQIVYRAAREILANIVKHAHAKKVRVTLEKQDSAIALVIADDGVGIPKDKSIGKFREGHIGLVSNRIRVEEAGGAFMLRSVPGAGTSVSVTVPL